MVLALTAFLAHRFVLTALLVVTAFLHPWMTVNLLIFCGPPDRGEVRSRRAAISGRGNGSHFSI